MSGPPSNVCEHGVLIGGQAYGYLACHVCAVARQAAPAPSVATEAEALISAALALEPHLDDRGFLTRTLDAAPKLKALHAAIGALRKAVGHAE